MCSTRDEPLLPEHLRTETLRVTYRECHLIGETVVRQERDVFAGGGGKGNAAFGQYAPRLADKYMENMVISGTKSDKPPRPREQAACHTH